MAQWTQTAAPLPEGRHLLTFRDAFLVAGRHGDAVRLCLVFGANDHHQGIRIFCKAAVVRGSFLAKLIGAFRGFPVKRGEMGRIDGAAAGAPVPEAVIALLRPLCAWAHVRHVQTASGRRRAVLDERRPIVPANISAHIARTRGG